ncbi:MAG TPA: DUF4127 family protein [Oculatellaceae cyanobacterium]|jgi:hypothetical protein
MPFSHKRIFLVPLDSRPVCYDMPARLAAVAGLQLCMPSPNLLGHLKKPANFKTLARWIKNHLFENDPVIVALDTIAYGGLIPSRLNEEPFPTLKKRVDTFFEQIQADACYGFSSILRIPAYNSAEEEPDYWAKYGKALYQYSAMLHETGKADPENIPVAVLDDFLKRREKNHALNEYYIALLANGRFDYLTFCQDDTGPYGLNVQEAGLLEAELKKRKLTGSAHIQTGADEVAACMLARWMINQQTKPVKVYPFYSSEQGRKLIAKFDGLPIETVVEKAIRACGATVAKKSADADLWLMVHTPEDRQGDHCEKKPARVQADQIRQTILTIEHAFAQDKPVSIADVAYANGSDPQLVSALLSTFEDLTGLYGYAGWNTPGNTIGTSVAMGLVRLAAERNRSLNMEAFCQLLLIRLADDWLYQSDVRHTVRSLMNGAAKTATPDEELLNILMMDGLELLKQRLGLENKQVCCAYPCQRTFEVEIGLK